MGRSRIGGQPPGESDVHGPDSGHVMESGSQLHGGEAMRPCTYEALELRDGGSDYLGKGVSKAVENVNTVIAPALIDKDPSEQVAVDNFMVQQLDGIVNEWGWCKQKLGANAILAVSLAVCKAGASVKNIPLYKHIANLAGNKKLVLPVPAFNVINGGSHAGNKLAMQACLWIWPSYFISQDIPSAVIKKKYGQDAVNVGDEGGFAPNIQENKEGLELLKMAIAKAGYTGKVVIGMDVAASEFYGSDKTYDLNFKEEAVTAPLRRRYGTVTTATATVTADTPMNLNHNAKAAVTGGGNRQNRYVTALRNGCGCFLKPWKNDGSQKISGKQLKDLYKSFVTDYPIVSIEDPFDQDDWEHHSMMTSEIGEKVQIVGDDLLVTNPKRVEKAIKEKSCNALLLKVNQIGSVTESIEAVKMSKHAGWGVMASHRSGETEDTFIADLSVGLATGQIKTGAPCRSERLAKNNQVNILAFSCASTLVSFFGFLALLPISGLLRIEEELGSLAVYAGANFRMPVEPY
ncbi:hypothetical protein TEA_019726 [Camellia sinensis var. sinensis]|uniref:phosphopyruvate hydratase n=1 Tax=Camellia sinensis var. sinensis TaxID=542762 RepID=A0A4S4E1Q8_CAMSN|nr:hypothetical protein TEA_019726 [Camellia sinensis var. sinensis]